MKIGHRKVGAEYPPLVIADIGINHNGNIGKALIMVDAAAQAGCECIKLQTHIPAEEMVENDIVPENANETIWNMMQRCSLREADEVAIKERAEAKGMIFLSTPFSKKAVDRLENLVPAYKIGSGECNNYPLVEYIASKGKPVILSTGMNDLKSIAKAVEILKGKVDYALLHCTSVYPTPYSKIRLGAIKELQEKFPEAVIGLSDHSLSNYPCYGAVALGASILERHFTFSRKWEGADIELSMEPYDLRELIEGSRAIHMAMGGSKDVLSDEVITAKFAYASVVAIKDIEKGEVLSGENVWPKRPGTGEISAAEYRNVLGKKATRPIKKDEQLKWAHIL